jgi:NAD(P)-dependent dehydrogenase (short-subunit alcohol dehydrogenase family)
MVELRGAAAVVTGGASGLGLASVRRLLDAGARVVILDLPGSQGPAVAAELGESVTFVPADVSDEGQVRAAFAEAESLGQPLRAVVHCAGRGGTLRILDREGTAGSLELFKQVVEVNLIGTFNVLRLGAEVMARTEPVDGERGAFVLTASVAAFEGQIGQVPYASSKAGIVGMTLVAARDLASRLIRVVTIAPGVIDTPLLKTVREEVRQELASRVPHPSKLGSPDSFARLAMQVFENEMINGETIRLDGALRMQPR